MNWKLTTFKMLLTTTTCLAAPSFENERIELKPVENQDQFKYVSVGAGASILTVAFFLPNPKVNVGMRKFNGRHCLDFGIGNYSYTGINAYGNYLHYFAPKSDKHFYLGLGAKTGGHLYGSFFAAPSAIIGLDIQKKTHHFYQIDMQYPAYISDWDHFWIFPLISLSYGVGF